MKKRNNFIDVFARAKQDSISFRTEVYFCWCGQQKKFISTFKLEWYQELEVVKIFYKGY
jgi:hypothetical protein